MADRYRVDTGLMSPACSVLDCWWIYDRANTVQCEVPARQFSGSVKARNKRAKLVADRICAAMNREGSMIEIPEFFPCETVHGILFHLRRSADGPRLLSGVSGQKDTLCGFKVGWDVTQGVEPTCRDCIQEASK